MFGLPMRNKYWPIALDIGQDSVKMLQLRSFGNELAVSACGRRKFSSDARNNPARRRELAVSAVRELMSQRGFKGRKVVTALSCDQLGIKSVRLPELPEIELEEAIRWEASERFSFDINADRLRYIHAGQVRQGTDTQDEYIVLAVPQETIDEHLAIVAEMGLHSVHIDAEPVALFRVFDRYLRRKRDTESVSIVLDIGASSTRVVVGQGRQIVFIKSIDIGGNRLSNSVARQLNLSFEEAIDLRSMLIKEQNNRDEQSDQVENPRLTKSVGWTIHDALRVEVEALSKEVALCLRYCSVTFRGLRSQNVIVTGGQACDPNVVKLLSEQLGVECVVGQPLRSLDVSSVAFGGDRRAAMPEWALCTGLALRQIEAGASVTDVKNARNRLSA